MARAPSTHLRLPSQRQGAPSSCLRDETRRGLRAVHGTPCLLPGVMPIRLRQRGRLYPVITRPQWSENAANRRGRRLPSWFPRSLDCAPQPLSGAPPSGLGRQRGGAERGEVSLATYAGPLALAAHEGIQFGGPPISAW